MNDLNNIKKIGSKIVGLVILIFLVFITFAIGTAIGTNDKYQAKIDTEKEITANEIKVKDVQDELETTKKDKEEIEKKITDIEKFLEEAE